MKTKIGKMYKALPLDIQEIIDGYVWDLRHQEIKQDFLKELRWFQNEMWWYQNTTPIPTITCL
jgi:hypothetical protein